MSTSRFWDVVLLSVFLPLASVQTLHCLLHEGTISAGWAGWGSSAWTAPWRARAVHPKWRTLQGA
jgi:hypothetical protein